MHKSLYFALSIMLVSCGLKKLPEKVADSNTNSVTPLENEIGFPIIAQIHFSGDLRNLQIKTKNFLGTLTSRSLTDDRGQFGCRIGETVEGFIGQRKLFSAYCQRDLFIASIGASMPSYLSRTERAVAISSLLYYFSYSSSGGSRTIPSFAHVEVARHEVAGSDFQGDLNYIYDANTYEYIERVQLNIQSPSALPSLPLTEAEMKDEMETIMLQGMSNRYSLGPVATMLNQILNNLGFSGGSATMTGRLTSGPAACSKFMSADFYISKVDAVAPVTKDIYEFGLIGARFYDNKNLVICTIGNGCRERFGFVSKDSFLGRTTTTINPTIDASVSATYGTRIDQLQDGIVDEHILGHIVLTPSINGLEISGGLATQSPDPNDPSQLAIKTCRYLVEPDILELF